MTSIDMVLQRVFGDPLPDNRKVFWEYPRLLTRERHFLIVETVALNQICELAKEGDAWLLSLFACDERELLDHAFKVYSLLSLPDGQVVTLEHSLREFNQDDQPIWHSLTKVFRAAEPLEREMADLFGIAIEPALCPSLQCARC
jgi:Ni,Fe-hydrogenase III component G